MEQALQDQYLEVAWQRHLKSNNDLSDRNQVSQHQIRGAISSDDPNLTVVYTNKLLRVCDIHKSETPLKQVVYGEDKLIEDVRVDQGYILSKVYEGDTRQLTSLEVRKHNSSEFNKISYPAIDIRKTLIIPSQTQEDGDLLVVLKGDNVVEVRQFKDGGIISLNNLRIDLVDQSHGHPFIAVDIFQLSDSSIVFNLEHKILVLITLESLKTLDRLDFAHSLSNITLNNDLNAFKVKAVDLYETQLRKVLCVVKTSLDTKILHTVEVFEYATLKIVKEVEVNPVIDDRIRYSMNSELFQNQVDDTENREPEYTGPRALTNERKNYKVLDVYSCPFGFFVLVQEQYLLILFRLDPYDGSSVEQVNQTFEKSDSSIVNHMLDCKINRSTVQYQSDLSLNFSVYVLTSSGSSLVGFDMNTALNRRHLFLAELSKDKLSDIPQLTFELYQGMQIQIDDQEIIINELITAGQYRKLAELVLLKDKRLEKDILEAINAVKDLLVDRLNYIKENKTVGILKQVKAYQATPIDNVNERIVGQLKEYKKQIEEAIGDLLVEIDGIKIVFNALLKRQIERSKMIQLNINKGQARGIDEEDINIIKTFILENVDKLQNFLRIIQFMVQTDFIKFVFLKQEQLKAYHLQKFPRGYSGPFFIHELLSYAPNMIPKLPLFELEDYIALLDSSVIVHKPLSVLYYHLLDVQDVAKSESLQGWDLRTHFSYLLDNALSEADIKSITALHYLDNLNGLYPTLPLHSKLIVSLLGQNQFKELNPQILRKLVLVKQYEAALLFINTREAINLCRHNDSLGHILEVYISMKKEREFLQFMREHEAYIQEETYVTLIQLLVDQVIKGNKTIDVIFSDSLSQKQDQIVSDHLKSKYPDLEFAHQIWKRDQVKGLSYGFQLNLQAQSLVPAQMPSNQFRRSLVHQYAASLSDEATSAAILQSSRNTGIQPNVFQQDLQEQQRLREAEQKLKGTHVSTRLEHHEVQTKLTDLKSQFLADPFFAKKAQPKPSNLLSFFRGAPQSGMDVDITYNQEQQQYTKLQVRNLGVESQVSKQFVYSEPHQSIVQPKQTRLFPNQMNLVDYNIHQELRRSMASSPLRASQLYEYQQQEGRESYSPTKVIRKSQESEQAHLKYSGLSYEQPDSQNRRSYAYSGGAGLGESDLREQEGYELDDPIGDDQQMLSPTIYKEEEQIIYQTDGNQESLIYSKGLSIVKESVGEDAVSEGYDDIPNVGLGQSYTQLRPRRSEDVQRSRELQSIQEEAKRQR